MTETKPKRRWFRFSLRTLFVPVTVLCVWLGFKVNAARRQKEAVEAILKAGGTVQYDYQLSPFFPRASVPWAHYFDGKAVPSGPPLLRKLFGDDCFRKVIIVKLDSKAIRESVLPQLNKLPYLENVYLTFVKIVSDGSNVSRQIQDSDLVALGQLSRLKLVEIFNANITCSSLAQLTQLRDLRVLTMVSAHIDDSSMELVGAMTQLEWLRVDYAEITDEGLKHLQRLRNLKVLEISYDFGITDAGLKYLSVLKSLTDITLTGTPVTPEGIHELQKSLPITKIDRP